MYYKYFTKIVMNRKDKVTNYFFRLPYKMYDKLAYQMNDKIYKGSQQGADGYG